MGIFHFSNHDLLVVLMQTARTDFLTKADHSLLIYGIISYFTPFRKHFYLQRTTLVPSVLLKNKIYIF